MVIFKSFENFCGFLGFILATIGVVILLAMMIIEACGKVTKAMLEVIVLVVFILLFVWIIVIAPDNSINSYEDIERMSVEERIRSEQMILGR